MLLRLCNIGKSYPVGGSHLEVLKNVSFEISPGDRVWVRGRNGSGKSTLLKIVSGQMPPDTGTIEKGRDDLRISLLSQSIATYVGRNLTLAEHLAVGVRGGSSSFLRKLVTPSFRKEAQKSLERFDLGLEDRLDDFVGNLSGGEGQLIGILTLLSAESDILCLDEPSASLDFRVSEVVQDLLKNVTGSRKMGLVFASHDSQFGGKMANRFVDLG